MNITNMTCTGRFTADLHLPSLADIFKSKLKPRFSGLPVKYFNATLLLFRNGKVVIVGCDSELDAELTGNLFAEELRRHGYSDVTFKDFAVRNMTCSGCFGPLNLRKLARDYSHIVSYEQEIFPGLIMRSSNKRITFTIFSTGSFILTGGKSYTELTHEYERLHNILSEYNMKNLRLT